MSQGHAQFSHHDLLNTYCTLILHNVCTMTVLSFIYSMCGVFIRFINERNCKKINLYSSFTCYFIPFNLPYLSYLKHIKLFVVTFLKF